MNKFEINDYVLVRNRRRAPYMPYRSYGTVVRITSQYLWIKWDFTHAYMVHLERMGVKNLARRSPHHCELLERRGGPW